MARKPSWKKALGITKAQRDFTRKTGIPTTKAGLKRKAKRKAGEAAGCCIPLAFTISFLFFLISMR